MSMSRKIRLLLSGGSRVNIDGRDFTGGRNVVIKDNEVWIDGVKQHGTLTGPVSVTVHGDVLSIDGPATSVEVAGTCGTVKTMSGDVRCGDVTGDVGTMSGDITCGNVRGNVKTISGDIIGRRE
jgi:DUF4097 and DUF4098 domain-containing protein YvlB